MKFSRRDLLVGTSASAIALSLPEQSDAWTHGTTGGVGGSQSRVLINVPKDGQLYLNLAKGWPVSLPPGNSNQTSDGYPVNGTLSTSASSNLPFPAGYFGKFAWVWTGGGGMDSSGAPWIVYSGGLSVYPNGASVLDGAGSLILGSVGGSVTSPLVIFNFGWNIQSIGNDGTGRILITVKSTYLGAYTPPAGQKVLVSGTETSADSATPWVITAYGSVANTFVLAGSTYVSSAGVGGTAILDGCNQNTSFRGGQTFTNMTNLIICKYTNGTTDDYHDVTVNGYIADTVLVNQLIYLNNAGSRGTPAWLRFMDLLTGGRGFNSDFTNRMPATAVNYNTIRFINNCWAGTVANSSNAFSCSDPTTSVWSGSAYIDGSVVQGTIASTNVTGYATLAVGGHPTAPIYYNDNGFGHQTIQLPNAPSSAGLTLQWTFNAGGASYLNSGSNYTFSYTTVSGDVGNTGTFWSNVGTAMQAALTAHTTNNEIQLIGKPSLQYYVFCPTPLANGTTGAPANILNITYSGATATNIYIVPPSTMSGNSTFIYNALLQGWIYVSGGIGSNVPLEVLTDFCNRVGAHCYYCWDVTVASYVTGVTNFFTANLNSGLKFGTETGNEAWNSGTFPYFTYSALGAALGWQYNNNAAVLAYTGLRTVQYAATSRAAWASAGKPAADHVVFSQSQISQTGVGSDTYNYQFTGTQCNGNTFPIYAAHGGLGGVSTANHDTAGTRPIDASDYIGCAPYWGSPWFGGDAYSGGSYGGLVGTVAQNAPMLQASYDYANGSPSTAFAALVNQFNGTTLRSDFCTGNVLGPIYGGVQGTSYNDVFSAMEATAATFDTYRSTGGGSPLAAGANKLGIICYEGGPNWAMGNDPNNGVNSPVGNPSSADITALTNAFTNLGWTTGQIIPYTVSGTGNLTEVATNILNMSQAWRYDASYNNLIKTSYFQKLYSYCAANREVHPAQYGYSASQWGLFPGNYSEGNQYTNYDAIHEWNA